MGKEILIQGVDTNDINLEFDLGLDFDGVTQIQKNKCYSGSLTVNFITSGDFSGYSENELRIIIANAAFEKLRGLSL